LGCKVVRTYNNLLGISDFTNYVDYTVCINSLSNIGIEDEDNDVMSQGTAYIVIFGLMFALLITMIIIGFAVNMPNVGFIVGIVSSLIILILATIPDVPFIGGYISAWITILIFLICIVISILIGLKGITPQRE
jgi:hypothetical protein